MESEVPRGLKRSQGTHRYNARDPPALNHARLDGLDGLELFPSVSSRKVKKREDGKSNWGRSEAVLLEFGKHRRDRQDRQASPPKKWWQKGVLRMGTSSPTETERGEGVENMPHLRTRDLLDREIDTD